MGFLEGVVDPPPAHLPIPGSIAHPADHGQPRAEERRTRTGALAEDMEAFGVALACRLHGARLTVVRGVSNRAGDRDVGRWRIGEALEEAHRLGLETLAAG